MVIVAFVGASTARPLHLIQPLRAVEVASPYVFFSEAACRELEFPIKLKATGRLSSGVTQQKKPE